MAKPRLKVGDSLTVTDARAYPLDLDIGVMFMAQTERDYWVNARYQIETRVRRKDVVEEEYGDPFHTLIVTDQNYVTASAAILGIGELNNTITMAWLEQLAEDASDPETAAAAKVILSKFHKG